MGRLVFYESKKLMGKRLIPAMLLFLFAFNGLILYQESGQRIDWSYPEKTWAGSMKTLQAVRPWRRRKG